MARGYRALKIVVGAKRKRESESVSHRHYESSIIMRESVRRCRAGCRVQSGGDHVGGGSTRAWTVQPAVQVQPGAGALEL